jgi:hypothetical protein
MATNSWIILYLKNSYQDIEHTEHICIKPITNWLDCYLKGVIGYPYPTYYEDLLILFDT